LCRALEHAPTGPTFELGSVERGVGVETPITAPLPQRPGNFCDRESSGTHRFDISCFCRYRDHYQ
jgi:hypothetical protein